MLSFFGHESTRPYFSLIGLLNLNALSENIYLVGSIFGILISLVMLFDILKRNKANFFIGLVVFIMAIELLFSWTVKSGYANTANAFPFWKLLNYLIIPPALWLFVKFNTNDNFILKRKHFFLFTPAIIAYIIEFSSSYIETRLISTSIWLWFTDYLPLLATIIVLINFWIQYSKSMPFKSKKTIRGYFLNQIRMLLLISSLSLVCIMWVILSFTGGKYFEYVEFILLFMFFGFTILNFIGNQNFIPLTKEEKIEKFPNYDDQKNLKVLKDILDNDKPFLQPNFPLQELSRISNLPPRYVSYLINNYHQKKYKEFINDYRIQSFIEKAKSKEVNSKTLLGLALDSGFNSKSTFNLVFKNSTGKSPSEYLNTIKK